MWTPNVIVLLPEAKSFSLTQTVLSRLPHVPVVETEAEGVPYLADKKSLILRPIKGALLKACPGTAAYRCCGYQILNTGLNCGFDCTYCILQDYLESPAQTVYVDLPEHLESLKQEILAEPTRRWRIGTGEYTDSLIHDPWTGLSGLLLNWARDLPNVILELKTKSIHIEELLRHPAPPNVVVAWSVNTVQVTKDLELGTPTLSQRLEAAKQVVAKGYSVAFHFDPIVPYDGFELAYQGVVEEILATIPANKIKWVSLGVLRFTKGMYDRFKRRSPQYLGEMILAPDQKWRFPRPTRVRAYQAVLSALHANAPTVYTYLCMESPEVWDAVYGFDHRDNKAFEQAFDEAVF